MDGTEVAVRSVRTVGSDTVALELETPDGFEARPGQFVQLAATVDTAEQSSASNRRSESADDGEEITRHYTLSSPDSTETFEVTVEVDPEGSLSPYLAGLEPGATVEVAGPFGDAYYEGEESVVVVAGGPGIGPAVGIGERAIADGGEVTIVYEDADPVHEDRLADLAAEGATVAITADLSEESVVSLLASSVGQVFVYGFAEFLDRATAALDAGNLDSEAAKTENFGPAP